jgi:hypothetical protein
MERKNISAETIRRFEANRSSRGDGCWEWTGPVMREGYGRFTYQKGKRILAHRLAFLLSGRTLDPALVIDHTCHNRDESCKGGRTCPHRRCVNPDHLEQVTSTENILRGKSPPAKFSRVTKCSRGHLFTPENTRLSADGHYRDCLACARIRQAKIREKRRNGRPNPGPAKLRKECKHGHPYDEANTYVDKRGYRWCRTCARIKEQRRRDRMKAEK